MIQPPHEHGILLQPRTIAQLFLHHDASLRIEIALCALLASTSTPCRTGSAAFSFDTCSCKRPSHEAG